jgi:hypothetical protein
MTTPKNQMQAIILYKTNEQLDCDKTNINEQIEDFFDDHSSYDVKSFSDEESMFQTIYDALGKPSVGVTACNILETRDYVYVGYFIDIAEILNYGKPDDSEEIILEKINTAYTKAELNLFGSQITSQHVTSNLVIIKKRLEYDVSDKNVRTTMHPLTLTLSELKEVIENVIVKNGIVIDTNGDMSSYKYIMNPMEHLMLSDKDYKDHYIYHEYEIYTHVMIIVVDVREVDGKINEPASFLAGNVAKGRVFVSLYKKPEYTETPSYVSLNLKNLKNIIEIRKRSVDSTIGVTQSEKEYINFEKILELECSKYSDKPVVRIKDFTGECLNKK